MFDPIRKVDQEPPSSGKKIKLAIDQDDAFNYGTTESKYSDADVINMMLAEANFFKHTSADN